MQPCGGQCFPGQDNVTENTLIRIKILPIYNALGIFSNKNQCFFCNVTIYHLNLVMIMPRHGQQCLGMVITESNVYFVPLQNKH